MEQVIDKALNFAYTDRAEENMGLSRAILENAKRLHKVVCQMSKIESLGELSDRQRALYSHLEFERDSITLLISQKTTDR